MQAYTRATLGEIRRELCTALGSLAQTYPEMAPSDIQNGHDETHNERFDHWLDGMRDLIQALTIISVNHKDALVKEEAPHEE